MSTDHKVTLTPEFQGNNVRWEMQYGNKKGSDPNNYPVIKLDHDSGQNKIEFVIAPGNNITFLNPPDKSDKPIYAMEVPKGSGNKPSKGVLNYQITKWEVSTDGKTLTIMDKNSGMERTLSYQLNFTGTVAPLDPIIENGGGGKNLEHYYAMGGILLFAIVAYFAGRWLARRAEVR
jgi:hypothetical protein